MIGVVGLEMAETDTVRVNSPMLRGETRTAVAFFGEGIVRPEVGVCGVSGPLGEFSGALLPCPGVFGDTMSGVILTTATGVFGEMARGNTPSLTLKSGLGTSPE